MSEQLQRDLGRWWARRGHKLDRIDVSALVEEPWARERTCPSELAQAVFRLLERTIYEGDCISGSCAGYLADPASLRAHERPCELCAKRWDGDGDDDWRGPTVVMNGVELCPACQARMEGEECACCGHRPRGRNGRPS